MKNLSLLVALVAIVIGLQSCSDFEAPPQAKCKILYQNANVIVTSNDLKMLEEGDTIFLQNTMQTLDEAWTVADGNSYSKDTTFIFNSNAGPYPVKIAKAVIVKKAEES